MSQKCSGLTVAKACQYKAILMGAKYAAFIDESAVFAAQEMRKRGDALAEMVMEKLKAVDGKCLIECASEEFISFIEDAYRCLKSR